MPLIKAILLSFFSLEWNHDLHLETNKNKSQHVEKNTKTPYTNLILAFFFMKAQD